MSLFLEIPIKLNNLLNDLKSLHPNARPSSPPSFSGVIQRLEVDGVPYEALLQRAVQRREQLEKKL